MKDNDLAGLWKRVGGALIDFIIVVVITFGIVFCWGLYLEFKQNEYLMDEHLRNALWEGRGAIVGFLVDFIYSVATQGGSRQSTFGQRACGIKLRKINGERLGYETAIVRYITSLISSIFLKLGYVIAIFTQNKQTLHDLAAGTIAVKDDFQYGIRDRGHKEIVYKQEVAKDTSHAEYSYAVEDAKLEIGSLKEKYKVSDYDLAEASNELKNNTHNQITWNFCTAENTRTEDAKRQYIVVRAQEIAHKKYRNEIRELEARGNDNQQYITATYNFKDTEESRERPTNATINDSIRTIDKVVVGAIAIIVGTILFLKISSNNKAKVSEPVTQVSPTEEYNRPIPSVKEYSISNCNSVETNSQASSEEFNRILFDEKQNKAYLKTTEIGTSQKNDVVFEGCQVENSTVISCITSTIPKTQEAIIGIKMHESAKIFTYSLYSDEINQKADQAETKWICNMIRIS